MQIWLDSLISLSSTASLDQKRFRQYPFTTCASYSCWWNKGFWFRASGYAPHPGERHPAGSFGDPRGPTDPSLHTCSSTPAWPPVLPATIPPVLRFMISNIFRSPSFLKDGVCISLFHSPCCFGVFSETRRGEHQAYSATYNLEVLSRSNLLLQPGVLSPYDFQSPIKCIFSLKHAVYMLVISNLILKSLWLTQGLRAS